MPLYTTPFHVGVLSGRGDANPRAPYGTGGGGAPITWAVDATSGIAYPANATQWSDFIAANSLAIGVPDGLWLCQDASGGAAPAIGSISLVEEGARIDYQQTVAGHSRKAIISRGDALFSTDAGLANPATTSILLFMVAAVEVAAVTNDRVYIGGTNTAKMQMTDVPVIRITQGGSIADGVSTVNSAPHPYDFRFNQTTDTIQALSDAEKVSMAKTADPDKLIAFTGSPAPGVTKILYAAYWAGAKAEISDADLKAARVAAGWTYAW